MKFSSKFSDLTTSRVGVGLGVAAMAFSLSCTGLPSHDEAMALQLPTPAPTDVQIKGSIASGVGWWTVETKNLHDTIWQVKLAPGAAVIHGEVRVGFEVSSIELQIPESNTDWNNFLLSHNQRSDGVVLPFFVQQDGSILSDPQQATFGCGSAMEFLNPGAV